MIFKVCISLILLLLLILIITSFIFFRSFFLNKRREKDYSKSTQTFIERAKFNAVCKDKFLNLPYEKINIKSGRYNLVGYYLSNDSNKTAVLLHGWKGSSDNRMADAFRYIDNGYNVFLPDLRSHGKSDGKYIGMGCVERRDIFKWIDYLREKYGDDKSFILDGISMGGATVLSLSGEKDANSYIKAIISDCAYTSVKDLIPNHANKTPKIFRNILIKMVQFWCKLLCGFSFNDDSPIDLVKKSKIPILFIHGTEDKFVPFDMCKKLYDACSSEKEYWAVEGATHIMSSWVAKEEYTQKAINFLNRYI